MDDDDDPGVPAEDLHDALDAAMEAARAYLAERGFIYFDELGIVELLLRELDAFGDHMSTHPGGSTRSGVRVGGESALSAGAIVGGVISGSPGQFHGVGAPSLHSARLASYDASRWLSTSTRRLGPAFHPRRGSWKPCEPFASRAARWLWPLTTSVSATTQSTSDSCVSTPASR